MLRVASIRFGHSPPATRNPLQSCIKLREIQKVHSSLELTCYGRLPQFINANNSHRPRPNIVKIRPVW